MKKTRIRRVSKRDDRTLERKVDALWQRWVIRRAKGRCEILGCHRPATVAHHMIGRDNKVFRHHPDNGFAMCQACHDRAHHDPKSFLAHAEMRYPDRHALWRRRHELLDVSMPYHLLLQARLMVLR